MDADCAYINLDIEQSIDVSDQLNDSFRWINILVLCCPMWSTRHLHSNQKRSRCLSIMVVTLCVLGSLYHLAWNIIFYGTAAQKSNGAVYQIIYCLLEVLYTLSRFLSLYYFYHHFAFPWTHSKSLPLPKSQIRTIQTYNRIIVLFSVILFTVDVLLCIHYYSELFGDSWYLIYLVVGRLTVFYPIFVTFMVVSAIFLKYGTMITQLTQEFKDIQSGSIEIDGMLDEYVMIRKQFRLEYPSSLNWSIVLYLYSLVLDNWVYAYEIVQLDSWGDLFGVVEDICILAIFVLPASLIAEAFEKYESMLYEYGVHHKKKIDSGALSHLMAHVSKYPLQVRTGNVTITKLNTLKFVVLFILGRSLSWSIQHSFTDEA